MKQHTECFLHPNARVEKCLLQAYGQRCEEVRKIKTAVGLGWWASECLFLKNAFAWCYIIVFTVNNTVWREFHGDGGDDNTAGQQQNNCRPTRLSREGPRCQQREASNSEGRGAGVFAPCLPGPCPSFRPGQPMKSVPQCPAQSGHSAHDGGSCCCCCCC